MVETAARKTVARAQRKETNDGAPASIVVIGVGGGGCNAVMRMLEQPPVPGVRYICTNTDVKSLGRVSGAQVIQIGAHITHGLGAGGIPDVGAQAADEGKEALKRAISKGDLVFLAAGMGGGTGTGAAPVVAEVARQSGALVVAVVTTPFSFEGARRLETAHSGIAKLRDKVDNLIVIHNDRLMMMFNKDVPMNEALKRADDAVMLGILSVAEVVNKPGEINVDYADLKSIMKLPGLALMAVGEAKGKDAAQEAARMAVSNPLLDLSIEGAKGVLFDIHGGPNLSLGQVNAVGSFIASHVDPGAMIFFGMLLDKEMEDKVHITIIATGIPPEKASRRPGLASPQAADFAFPGKPIMAGFPPATPTNGQR
ncbi:MAG: cell division protein FtsZ [Chloroflexota bacterium]|nr:cell division protein FtsZ [Chloroflexota bacterium]